MRVGEKLVAGGIQLIEVCGAFKRDMSEQVSQVVDGKVPVDHIEYSEEARKKLVAFFKK